MFFAGSRGEVLKLEAFLKKRWELAICRLGPGLGDQRELPTLRWCRDGLVLSADVRHAREVIEELGLAKSLLLLSQS